MAAGSAAAARQRVRARYRPDVYGHDGVYEADGALDAAHESLQHSMRAPRQSCPHVRPATSTCRQQGHALARDSAGGKGALIARPPQALKEEGRGEGGGRSTTSRCRFGLMRNDTSCETKKKTPPPEVL